MENYEKVTEELLRFIEGCPSAFHAAKSLSEVAKKAGYTQLAEQDDWEMEKGRGYYVMRNDSSLIAMRIPQGEIKGFHIAAVHSDSPTFKIKENPEIKSEGNYVKLNTERYGGAIMSTWLDRPLSVAGRVAVRENDMIVSRLVNADRDLLVIPNLAIHMNRDVNKGLEYNAQTDMLPLFAAESDKSLMEIIAESCNAGAGEILAHDLYLYVRQKGTVFGAENEFILSPRLDDLQCAYSAMTAMANSTPDAYVNICAVFDSEEVGNGTRQGADSTFLEDVLVRMQETLGENGSWLRRMIAGSFLISADNAHALHPNQPAKADPTNRPLLNGGIVIKYHGSQKYATDAVSSAIVKDLCLKAGVPFQTYANRSDIVGGTTLGNVSMTHVSVPSVDIGLPQLAMHSAVETAGAKDAAYMITLLEQFYCL